MGPRLLSIQTIRTSGTSGQRSTHAGRVNRNLRQSQRAMGKSGWHLDSREVGSNELPEVSDFARYEVRSNV